MIGVVPGSPKQRVLIYRLGSLGDTVVALPALHLVARVFPHAERWVLTNFSVSSKAAPMSEVLNGMGLVHGYIEYPIAVRSISQLVTLRRRIRALGAQTLIYMASPRGRIKALRDALFFRACGIRRLIGLPATAELQRVCPVQGDRYEYEAARIGRCLAQLGDVRLNDPASFDLRLSAAERSEAAERLGPLANSRPLLAASVGAKVDVQDWGDANWRRLLRGLSSSLPGWGLVMLGSAEERRRCEHLLNEWVGTGFNLCGALSVRVSAAILTRCRMFVGHDSGPMHLAAAVGIPCVAVFSSRNLPGEWFPYGPGHRILYRPMPCQGCRLDVCLERGKACIRSITAEEVLAAITAGLSSYARVITDF